jgi:hypothetical protein
VRRLRVVLRWPALTRDRAFWLSAASSKGPVALLSLQRCLHLVSVPLSRLVGRPVDAGATTARRRVGALWRSSSIRSPTVMQRPCSLA